MSGSQHFITSFAASIFVGTVCAISATIWKDSFQELKVSPMVIVPVAFVIGHFFTRWFFKHWISVLCPYGCGNKAHPIPGRHDRFRCHSCGEDF